MGEKLASLLLPSSSKAAGAKLFCQRWLPEGPPRAVLILSHGFAEHSDRYPHFAARFTAIGYAVYALDHWGHGRSDGEGGFIPEFSVFTDGLTALLETAKAAHPDLPRFLVGHSMGGLIAANFLIQNQHEFRAAGLSGPALAPAKQPSALLRAISKILSRVTPRLGVIRLSADGVSRDPAVVAAYRADPLIYSGPITARLGYEMMQAMGQTQRTAPSISIPIFVQHGGADSLTAPSGSEAYFMALRSPQKAIKIYDGLYHEIYNEPEKSAVISDLIAFFDPYLS